jgi:hypothetical protein
MAEKTAWKAARVGSGEAAKVVGSERRGRRRGLRERAGRLSMREAAKAAGRPLPPLRPLYQPPIHRQHPPSCLHWPDVVLVVRR